MAPSPSRNKWVNQRINKRFINSHRSSSKYDLDVQVKSYGRKSRKGLYRQMEFDYDDFMSVYKGKRVQCVEAMYERYYFPDECEIEEMHTELSKTFDVRAVDQVIVEIDLYDLQPDMEISEPKQDAQARRWRTSELNSIQRQSNRLNSHRSRNDWSWSHYLPTDPNQENTDLQLAIAASLLSMNGGAGDVSVELHRSRERLLQENRQEKQKRAVVEDVRFAGTTLSVRGSETLHFPRQFVPFNGNRSPVWFAETAWEFYKNNHLWLPNVLDRHLRWHVSTDSRSYRFELDTVLEESIPSLWPMHELIFGYMGYDSFHVQKVLVISSSPPRLYRIRSKWSGGRSGIRWETAYTDLHADSYADTALTYIPNHTYHNRTQGKPGRPVAQAYSPQKWLDVTFFDRKKQRKIRQKMRKR